MSYFRYDNIEVEEAVVLTFPFADELAIPGAALSSIVLAEAVVVAGVDVAAAAFIVTAQISGTDVLVAVAAQVKNVDYEIRVTCATTDTYTRLTRVGRIFTE